MKFEENYMVILRENLNLNQLLNFDVLLVVEILLN